MINKIKNRSLFGVPVSFVMTLHLLSFLYLSKFNIIRYIGALASLSIVLICFLFVLVNFKTIKVNFIWYSGIVLIFINTINLLSNFNANSFYLWAQQSGLLLYAMSISSIPISDSSFQKVKKVLSAVYFVFLFVSSILIILNRETIFLNYFSGTSYKAFFALSFFALSNPKRKLLSTVFSSIIFILIGERTAALSLLFIYVIFKLLDYLKHHRKLYSFLYWVLAGLMVSIPKLYVWLSHQAIAIELNAISLKYFHSRFFSGRNIIWSIAYDTLRGNELFGLGLGNSAIVDQGVNLSTHNLYIYLLLQGGYVLLSLYLIFMFFIWRRYFNYLSDERVRLSAAYFMGIMLFLNFELLLLVNNFVVSMYLWLIIGLGILIRNQICKENINKI